MKAAHLVVMMADLRYMHFKNRHGGVDSNIRVQKGRKEGNRSLDV